MNVQMQTTEPQDIKSSDPKFLQPFRNLSPINYCGFVPRVRGNFVEGQFIYIAGSQEQHSCLTLGYWLNKLESCTTGMQPYRSHFSRTCQRHAKWLHHISMWGCKQQVKYDLNVHTYKNKVCVNREQNWSNDTYQNVNSCFWLKELQKIFISCFRASCISSICYFQRPFVTLAFQAQSRALTLEGLEALPLHSSFSPPRLAWFDLICSCMQFVQVLICSLPLTIYLCFYCKMF